MHNPTSLVALLSLFISVLASGGCESTIQSRLDEEQANDVIVALHDQGIGAAKDLSEGTRGEPRYDVTVSAREAGRALSVLHKTGLPRTKDPGINEIFDEGGLVPTATEERARYISALCGELAQSIEGIDGVLDARVHLAIPDKRMFVLDEAPPTPSASVLIKHADGVPPYGEESIRLLVAGAIEDMQPDQVTVVSVASEPIPAETGGLVRVGPFSVARGSALPLRAVLVAALGIVMLLGVALGWTLLNRKREPASG